MSRGFGFGEIAVTTVTMITSDGNTISIKNVNNIIIIIIRRIASGGHSRWREMLEPLHMRNLASVEETSPASLLGLYQKTCLLGCT